MGNWNVFSLQVTKCFEYQRLIFSLYSYLECWTHWKWTVDIAFKSWQSQMKAHCLSDINPFIGSFGTQKKTGWKIRLSLNAHPSGFLSWEKSNSDTSFLQHCSPYVNILDWVCDKWTYSRGWTRNFSMHISSNLAHFRPSSTEHIYAFQMCTRSYSKYSIG